jgi:hypothetical protein
MRQTELGLEVLRLWLVVLVVFHCTTLTSRRRVASACFCSSDKRRFLRNGLAPIRNGHNAQSVATHLRTSEGEPQQQSMHFALMAARGFFSLYFWERISEGTSLRGLPTSSPPSDWKGDISRRIFVVFPHRTISTSSCSGSTPARICPDLKAVMLEVVWQIMLTGPGSNRGIFNRL